MISSGEGIGDIKKVLFISSRPIYPIVGGDQIRTAQQLDFLLQRYEVDVVYQNAVKENDLFRNYAPAVRKVTCFHIPTWLCYIQTLRFLFNKLPLQVNYYYNSTMKKYIDSVIQDYDIVFCNNIRTAEYVRLSTGIMKMMDFVDAISMNYEKAKQKAHGLKKIIYEIDYRRCRKYEQQILDTFHRCAIISEVDRKYILKNGKGNLCDRE